MVYAETCGDFDNSKNWCFELVTGEDDKTIFVIYYQNDIMKEVYAKYEDVLFVDGMYR